MSRRVFTVIVATMLALAAALTVALILMNENLTSSRAMTKTAELAFQKSSGHVKNYLELMEVNEYDIPEF